MKVYRLAQSSWWVVSPLGPDLTQLLISQT
jgi:hypothetical protein